MFTGEQFDEELGFYYLRARYYDPSNGRFPSMDSWMGRSMDPRTLHKYLYVHANPANNTDPTGHFSLTNVAATVTLSGLANASIGAAMNALNPTRQSVWGDFASDFTVGALLAPVGGLIGRVLGPILRGMAGPVLRAVGTMNRVTLVGRSAWGKFLVRLGRGFVTRIAGYPPVTSTLMGRVLIRLFPNVKWQQHHIFIQQAWFRAGSPHQLYDDLLTNRGLQRIGNAGWNLMPIPASLNGFLGRSPVATQLFATFMYSVAVFGPTQLSFMINDAVNGAD